MSDFLLDARADHVRGATSRTKKEVPKAMQARVEGSLFLKLIAERIYVHRKNVVIVVTGESGSGKSYSGLRIGSKMDDSFGPESVFFDPKKLIASASDKTKKRGKFRLFDEAGVGAHNRNWQDVVNTSLIHLLQTWRVFGEGLILTVPYPSFLDPQVWKMCQYWVEMSPTELGTGVIKKIRPREDLKGRPIHYHFLRVPLDDGRMVAAPVHHFGLPNGKLAKWYEEASWDAKMQLQEKLLADVTQSQNEGGGAGALVDVINDVCDKMRMNDTIYRKTFKSGKVTINDALIMADYGLSQAKARAVAAKVMDRLSIGRPAKVA